MEDNDLFPSQSLSDRGQLNDFEFEAWLACQKYREEEKLLEDYPNKSKEALLKNKEIYLQSGLDFEGCQPLGKNHTFWCAVKSDNTPEFVKAFNSRKIEKAIWKRGPFPSNNFRSNKYATIMPPCAGVIYFYLFVPEHKKFNHYQHVLETLHGEMSWISSWLGESFCFWANANGLNNGYIKWADGLCVRAKSSNEDTCTGFGKPFEDEESQDNHLRKNDVYKTADNLGMNIRKIKPRAPNEELFIWYVGID